MCEGTLAEAPLSTNLKIVYFEDDFGIVSLIFMPPTRSGKGHIVLSLSVCTSICHTL